MREIASAFGLAEDLSIISSNLEKLFLSAIENQYDIVCVCLGTSNILGDSFGPLMGNNLTALKLPVFVYGTTQSNVDASNLNATLKLINMVHSKAYIIVLDALSTTDSTTVGNIVLSNQYIGLNPKVKVFADLFIYGTTTFVSPVRHNLYAKLNLINTMCNNLTKCFAYSLNNALRKNKLKFLEKCVLAELKTN